MKKKTRLGVKVSIPPVAKVDVKKEGDYLVLTVTSNTVWELTSGDDVYYGKQGVYTRKVKNENQVISIRTLD